MATDYKTNVEPYLEQIPEWYKTMTVRQIAQKLGVSKSAFYNYAAKHQALADALSGGKANLVDDLKCAIRQRALGYTWTETVITEGFDKDGNPVETKKTTTKHVPPDLGSAHLLLKNLDPDWHDADMTTIKQRERELEIKQQKADAAEW